MNVYLQDMGDDDPSLTPINLHILRNLWLPDVEILDLKAFETHSVLSKLEGRQAGLIWEHALVYTDSTAKGNVDKVEVTTRQWGEKESHIICKKKS